MTSVLLVTREPLNKKVSRKNAQALAELASRNISIVQSTFGDLQLETLLNSTDFVVFVPRHTYLFKLSLVELCVHLLENEHVSVAYGDDSGFDLPDFSPQRFLCQNYIQGPVALRNSSLTSSLVFDTYASPVPALYKLLLEIQREGGEFAHLSQKIARQVGKSPLELTEEEVKQSRSVLAYERNARGGGDVGEYLGQSVFESHGAVIGDPFVSIVIPSRAQYSDDGGDAHSLVVNAVTSIIEKTDYLNYEILVVVDEGADQQILSTLTEVAGEKLRTVTWTKPFNFSQKMNFGVLHSSAEYVLLLNDDVEVISSEWLTSMLALAQLPNAGMVGAMLYYSDDTVQHAGHAYFQGSPTHIGLGQPRGSQGPLSGYLVQREVSGVTAACALMPMEVFKAVGGFTSLLPGNFNDVDLCLKVGWKNFDIHWTPLAQLYHFESKTRDAHVHFYELDVIEHRWGLRLDDSRYWRGHPWAAA